MWISLENLNAKVARADDAEKAWLREYLSFDQQSWRGGRPHNDKLRMYSLVNEEFPTGFIDLVKKGAADNGFKVEVIDKRVPPAPLDPNADLTWLRDYQHAAVEAAKQSTRGILWCPTGSGKTEIAAGLAKLIPCRWTFLVHRATLLDQAAERFEKRSGMQAGRIGDGKWDVQERFNVATFQTLYQSLGRPECNDLILRTDGLIIDECHVLPADSFWKVAMRFRHAYYRIGLSGTPLARGDRRSILAIAALGKVIYRIKPDVLIAAGVLSRPKIKLVPVYQESDCPTWQGVYGQCVVRGAPRNRAIVECAKKAAKPCLVFVKEIKHGRLLMKAFEKSGISADFVWGTDSTERRKEAVQRLVRGDTEVLICSVIFQEGVDIPELRSVVIGSGGKSVIAALQRIGRGMRVSEGKNEFECWDIADRGNRWLERHARVRLRAYTSEGYETTILPVQTPGAPQAVVLNGGVSPKL